MYFWTISWTIFSSFSYFFFENLRVCSSLALKVGFKSYTSSHSIFDCKFSYLKPVVIRVFPVFSTCPFGFTNCKIVFSMMSFIHCFIAFIKKSLNKNRHCITKLKFSKKKEHLLSILFVHLHGREKTCS